MKVRRINFKAVICCLILLWGFTSCNDGEVINDPYGGLSGEGICFGVPKDVSSWEPDSRTLLSGNTTTLPCQSTDETFGVSLIVKEQNTSFCSEASRGTQVISKDLLKEFDVAAFYYKEGVTVAESFFTETVTDGVNTSGKIYYWPHKGTLDFMAIAPLGIARPMPTVGDYNANGVSFDYEVNEDVATHQDVMTAIAVGLNNRSTGAPVSLDFKHLLASVRFVVGDMQFIRIDALSISGVYGGNVTFTYDKDTNTWTNSVPTTKKTYTPGFVDTSGLPKGEEIAGNVNNGTFFMIPQTLPQGAQINVTYTELLTGETSSGKADISGQIWEAGKDYAYAFDIGTSFDVTIPTPANQDAHYIMLEMPYELGELSSYVSSITATAEFLDDGSNTSTKSGISLMFKENLSETQKQGFWTDARYVETITVGTDGGSSSSGVTKEADIRGESELSIGNKLSGSIVLFIEENNGTTDRNGQLVFTATLKNGQNVTIGQGNFKQLCPSWNYQGIGVERIEDTEKSYPYGFHYNRKKTYKTSGWVSVSAILSWILEWSLNSTITADGKFIKYNYGKVGIFGWTALTSIDINYAALNDVQSIAGGNDGLNNTKELYNFTGNTSISSIEQSLDNNTYLAISNTSGADGTPDDYAAFIALTCNRMYELKTTTKSQGEDPIITYKAVLYEENGNDIIEWYLPSSEEAKILKETGTSSQGISPLNGEYWSSTAGSDANAFAHSYTFNNNMFGSVNESKPRMDKCKVRAVRKKP